MRGIKTFLLVLCGVCIIQCSYNQDALASETNYDNLFEQAGQAWDIPVPIIRAIAKTESNFHPWAINIAGKGFYPQTKAEALALIRTALTQRKSFDIGLMQINNWWFKRLDLTPEQILDPESNILVGAWILAQEFNRYGYHWKAIGSYHTPVEKNPERARQYASKVLSGLGGGI